MKRDISKIQDDNRYLTEAGVGMERQADYKAGEKMQAAFHVMSEKEVEEHFNKNPEGVCGNLHNHFLVEVKTKKVKVFDDWVYPEPKGFISLYRTISSALVLYRLVCMFPNPHVVAAGADGYKVPWAIYLKHKKTGQVICMSEWKGTFGFRTAALSPKEMPKKTLEDLSALLNLLISNNSPHPYDGTVAGSVA